MHVRVRVCINPEEIAFPCLTEHVYNIMVCICIFQYAFLWASACMCVALQSYVHVRMHT